MSLASLSAASELNARLHTTGARPHCCSMPHPRRLAGLIASGDNLNWPRARSAILALRVAHGTSARHLVEELRLSREVRECRLFGRRKVNNKDIYSHRAGIGLQLQMITSKANLPLRNAGYSSTPSVSRAIN